MFWVLILGWLWILHWVHHSLFGSFTPCCLPGDTTGRAFPCANLLGGLDLHWDYQWHIFVFCLEDEWSPVAGMCEHCIALLLVVSYTRTVHCTLVTCSERCTVVDLFDHCCHMDTGYSTTFWLKMVSSFCQFIRAWGRLYHQTLWIQRLCHCRFFLAKRCALARMQRSRTKETRTMTNYWKSSGNWGMRKSFGWTTPSRCKKRGTFLDLLHWHRLWRDGLRRSTHLTVRTIIMGNRTRPTVPAVADPWKSQCHQENRIHGHKSRLAIVMPLLRYCGVPMRATPSVLWS